MVWFVSVEAENAEPEGSQPFDSLADATLYALDLADTLGTIAPEILGRKIHIIREGGFVELTLSVIPGGLTGGVA